MDKCRHGNPVSPVGEVPGVTFLIHWRRDHGYILEEQLRGVTGGVGAFVDVPFSLELSLGLVPQIKMGLPVSDHT